MRRAVVRRSNLPIAVIAAAAVLLGLFVWPGWARGGDGDSDGKSPPATSATTQTPTGQSVAASPTPTQTPAGPGQVSGVPTPAANCVTTQEAKDTTKVDVQRIGTEACAWVWRAVPRASTSAVCPSGWICTMHLTGDRIEVIEGNGQVRDVVAATWRMEAAYPASDAVHRNCELLQKEQQFGRQEVPSFPVVAGEGLNCGGLTSSTAPSSNGCPTSAEAVASAVGGSNWRRLAGTDNGWKYGPSSVATLKVPTGAVLDHQGGRAQSGQTVTAGEATLWCPA